MKSETRLISKSKSVWRLGTDPVKTRACRSNPDSQRFPMMDIETQDAFEMTFYESLLQRDRKNTQALELLGSLYAKYEMKHQALRIDRRLSHLLPRDPRVRYNLACSLSVMGRKQEAVQALKEAIELGYDDLDWARQDPDLNALKGYSAFDALLAE